MRVAFVPIGYLVLRRSSALSPAAMSDVRCALCIVCNSSVSVAFTLAFGFARALMRDCAEKKAAQVAFLNAGPKFIPHVFAFFYAMMLTFDVLTMLVFTTGPPRLSRRDAGPSWLACFAASFSLLPVEVIVVGLVWCGQGSLASLATVKLVAHGLFWVFLFRDGGYDSSWDARVDVEEPPSLRRAAVAARLAKKLGRRLRADGDGAVGELCVVCQDELAAGDDVVEMPCGHVLRADCAAQWWARSATCPICCRDVEAGEAVSPVHSPTGRDAAAALPAGGRVTPEAVEMTAYDV